MKTKTIKKSSLIVSAYNEFWESLKNHQHREYILQGGRGSFKSSAIALRLVINLNNNIGYNVVCFMQYTKYLRATAYNTISWAIEKLGMSDRFIFGKSPLRITHKITGNSFYFFGLDDPRKLKGLTINNKEGTNRWGALWFEEFSDNKNIEDIEIVLDTFIRGIHKPTIIYSYNPPRSPYHWSYKWKEDKQKDKNVFYLHTTYKDDDKGFHSEISIRRIQSLKKTNFKYYNWAYMGEGYLQDMLVYSGYQVQEVNKDNIAYVTVGIDYGTMNPTTYQFFAVTTNGDIYGIHEFYHNGRKKVLLPEQLTNKLIEELNYVEMHYSPVRFAAIDPSATVLKEAIKRQTSIQFLTVDNRLEAGITAINRLFDGGKLFISNKQENLLREITSYSYDKKKLEKGIEVPIKENDHTTDAMRYIVYALYKRIYDKTKRLANDLHTMRRLFR